ncbi:hypothetical protein OS493_029656 [Desmophyllum pertusum]|uniref:Uncharacterized protein n=1 Tax=Desmophyllum pertusum TaxID=174260 RepID=A0A9W9ZK74_9CNID|nr:hypothetical protein OS493_029656 [Desmophyllum pertusum]
MLLGALKLVYREGAVRCVSNVAYNSRWGCHSYSSFKTYPLNVIITDKHNNVIFPLPQFIAQRRTVPHMDLRIWFGEDFKNWSETDNQGRVCVDVMGYVIGDVGGAGGASGGTSSKAQALLKDLKASLCSIMQKSWK